MITYHTGDATRPPLDGVLVIAHVLSDAGSYGKGFASEVAERYPRARRRYRAWARGDRSYAWPFQLGAVQWVGVGADLARTCRFSDRWVANMVAQHGLRSRDNPHPLDLDALEQCLVRSRRRPGRTPRRHAPHRLRPRRRQLG